MNAQETEGARERLLDVSALEPCEPMERALEAVGELQPGEYVRLIHRQEPRLLYPMLEKLGMAWYTRECDPVEVLIYAKQDALAARAVAVIAEADGQTLSLD